MMDRRTLWLVSGFAVRPAIFAALALAVTGCSPEQPAEPNALGNSTAAPESKPAAGPPRLAVGGDGLQLLVEQGSEGLIRFGTPQDAVMRLLSDRGAAETGRIEECGPGPLDHAIWPDGLKLYFQDGKLAGWALDERSKGIATVSGIGIGSSRTELEKVQAIEVAETSLGTEFTSGAVAGLLDGPGREAKVTALWAGASCVFR